MSGTPEFMSPEQVLGAPLDARSDLYSLGATAYFALSGRLPFEGSTPTEVLARQVTEPAPPLASLGIAVSRKVGALVDRCLAKDPAHRPESARALAEQLGVALEQRRELPPALRAFVKRDGRLAGEGTFLASWVILPVAVGAGYFFGTIAGWTAFGLLTVVAPVIALVRAARNLSRLGFTHDDLAPAYRTEIELAREELSLGHRAVATTGERILGFIGKAASATTLLSLTGVVYELIRLTTGSGDGRLLDWLAPTFVLSLSAVMFSAIGYISVAQRRRDIDTEFWSRIWLGRFGRGLFGIARKLLGKRTGSSAMTHRATELSLGLAAEELYENLPKGTRHELRALPATLRRLQEDAQTLRARLEVVQEALADAGDAAAEHADLRAARDVIQSKLAATVAALETIRLDLLRLHAGGTTVAGVTTHLDMAADVSAGVQRIIAAQGEVEKLLTSVTKP